MAMFLPERTASYSTDVLRVGIFAVKVTQKEVHFGTADFSNMACTTGQVVAVGL
jgi:hypothetical protein